MNIFQKVWRWIENLFSTIEKKVEKLVPVATNIVQGVKKAIEDNRTEYVLEVVKFSIPGDTDDKIIDKAMKLAREYVPKIALQLQIINSITDLDDVNDQMVAVVEIVKQISPEEQSKYWHELAKQILYALADNKITWGEAGAIVEYHYKNYIKQ